MTVLEVIQRSAAFLAKKGVDTPRLQAELLLGKALNLPRMQLYLNFERVLTPPEEDVIRRMVVRRGEREPLQHIVGSTSFCGLEIEVSSAALIPRPETELLAEQAWMYLQTSPAVSKKGPLALDFGTGTGCIAIALATHCPSAQIIALDVDLAALELARSNVARHDLGGRIFCALSDGLLALRRMGDFDLIAANPPYIPTAEIAGLEPEVRAHDPRRALDGGEDGLCFFRTLSTRGQALLANGGKLMLEFGDGQENAIAQLLRAENWIVEQILNDYTHRPRILIASKPE